MTETTLRAASSGSSGRARVSEDCEFCSCNECIGRTYSTRTAARFRGKGQYEWQQASIRGSPDATVARMLLWFGVLAAVLLVTAFTSRLVERSPLSFPLMFKGLGFLLRRGGLLELDAHDLVLEVVATLTLALVLFLDVVRLERDGLRGRWSIPILVLGPGTAIILFLGAAALVALFECPRLPALMGGAALASTDPVVLREIVRDERIPHSIRQVMKVEVGVNDLVVLPVLLILIALAGSRVEPHRRRSRHAPAPISRRWYDREAPPFRIRTSGAPGSDASWCDASSGDTTRRRPATPSMRCLRRLRRPDRGRRRKTQASGQSAHNSIRATSRSTPWNPGRPRRHFSLRLTV